MTTADRIAAMAGITVADLDPSLLAALGTDIGAISSEMLAKMGVSTADLATGIEATRRVMRCTGWSAADAAEFVGTTAAIGDITGPALLLVDGIARVARRADA